MDPRDSKGAKPSSPQIKLVSANPIEALQFQSLESLLPGPWLKSAKAADKRKVLSAVNQRIKQAFLAGTTLRPNPGTGAPTVQFDPLAPSANELKAPLAAPHSPTTRKQPSEQVLGRREARKAATAAANAARSAALKEKKATYRKEAQKLRDTAKLERDTATSQAKAELRAIKTERRAKERSKMLEVKMLARRKATQDKVATQATKRILARSRLKAQRLKAQQDRAQEREKLARSKASARDAEREATLEAKKAAVNLRKVRAAEKAAHAQHTRHLSNLAKEQTAQLRVLAIESRKETARIAKEQKLSLVNQAKGEAAARKQGRQRALDQIEEQVEEDTLAIQMAARKSVQAKTIRAQVLADQAQKKFDSATLRGQQAQMKKVRVQLKQTNLLLAAEQKKRRLLDQEFRLNKASRHVEATQKILSFSVSNPHEVRKYAADRLKKVTPSTPESSPTSPKPETPKE